MNQKYDLGFSNVFRYISGANEKQSKIQMTTPVVSYEENDQLITGFYVPRKYDKKSAPKPKDQKVYLQELSSSIYIVISFRGSWSKDNFDKHTKTLKSYIKNNSYKITSPRLIFRYQPPFIPGIFRHNEIAFQVETV